jgi:hypothetical protein
VTRPDDFRRYAEEPLAFIDEVLGVTLYSRQREIVEAVRDHDRVAVKSGNATGKTTAAAVTMLAWLAGGPGSVVVSTSATDAQLRRVLWRETRGRFRHARGFFEGATVTDTELFVEPGWYATGFSTDTAEAFQGIHADRVLVVVDEASGVSEDIFDAVEGLLAGGDARLLLIGNPLRTAGSFFDAFNSRADEYATMTISAFDTPVFTGEEVPRELRRRLVSKRWVERLQKRAAGSNTFMVKVLGEFPGESDDAVVGLDDLNRAYEQTVEPGWPLVIGVDVARYGSDHTVVAVREGNRIRVVDSYQGKNLMHTSGRVAELARRLQESTGRRPTITIDDVGVGVGLVDRLDELREFKIEPFNAARSSSRPRDFPNKRSELWFLFAEVAPLLDLDPADVELKADLLAPTYGHSSDGKRVVEAKALTKKRLRRSPDRADAVLLTLAVEPPRAPGRALPRGLRTFVSRRRLDGGERGPSEAERVAHDHLAAPRSACGDGLSVNQRLSRRLTAADRAAQAEGRRTVPAAVRRSRRERLRALRRAGLLEHRGEAAEARADDGHLDAALAARGIPFRFGARPGGEQGRAPRRRSTRGRSSADAPSSTTSWAALEAADECCDGQSRPRPPA